MKQSNETREPGYYWVKWYNEWMVVQVDDHAVWICGYEVEYKKDTDAFIWGPKIEEPKDETIKRDA